MTHATAARLLSADRIQGAFDKALAAYQAAPNAHTLLSLNKAAIPLMAEVPQDKPWRQVSFLANDTVSCDFTAIRVVVDKRLVDDDVQRLARCLGYGLKATLIGEELGEPSATYTAGEEDEGLVFTLVEFAYDAKSSTRTKPDAKRAFEVARDYIRDGSPLRTTNREGPGTMNTRLAEGLGVSANLTLLRSLKTVVLQSFQPVSRFVRTCGFFLKMPEPCIADAAISPYSTSVTDRLWNINPFEGKQSLVPGVKLLVMIQYQPNEFVPVNQAQVAFTCRKRPCFSTERSQRHQQTIFAMRYFPVQGRGFRVAHTALSAFNLHLNYRRLKAEFVFMGQLTGESGPAGVFNYAYDPVGNRLAKVVGGSGGGTYFYNYDENDRLLSVQGANSGPTTYQYDANGNTIQAGSTPLTWDFENHLTDVGSNHYTYDALNGRVNVNGIGYLIDPNRAFGQVVNEVGTNGAVTASYDLGLGMLGGARGGSGYQTVRDGSGSIVALVSSGGTGGGGGPGSVAARYGYDAWGTPSLVSGSSNGQPFLGIGGEQYDADTGLYYLRSRYYDPQAGRFLSADPFGGYDSNPLTLHRYSYAGNDPINQSDPGGKDYTITDTLMSQQIAGLASVAFQAVGDYVTGQKYDAKRYAQAYGSGIIFSGIGLMSPALGGFTAAVMTGYDLGDISNTFSDPKATPDEKAWAAIRLASHLTLGIMSTPQGQLLMAKLSNRLGQAMQASGASEADISAARAELSESPYVSKYKIEYRIKFRTILDTPTFRDEVMELANRLGSGLSLENGTNKQPPTPTPSCEAWAYAYAQALEKRGFNPELFLVKPKDGGTFTTQASHAINTATGIPLEPWYNHVFVRVGGMIMDNTGSRYNVQDVYSWRRQFVGTDGKYIPLQYENIQQSYDNAKTYLRFTDGNPAP